MKRSETDIARPMVAYLQGLGWEVHQEVQLYSGGKRADIVALQGRLTYVVECKVSMSWDLLEQAADWLGRAHYVSVATPSFRRGFAERVLTGMGIGVYVVLPNSPEGVHQILGPRLFRRADDRIRSACCVETKSGEYAEAGSTAGGFFTPFARTTRSIISELTQAGGELPTRDLVSRIKHHYGGDATARSCLVRWARLGKIKGVEIVEGRPTRFRLVRSEAKSA